MSTRTEAARRTSVRVAPVVSDTVATGTAPTASTSGAVAVLEEGVSTTTTATLATPTSRTTKASAAAHVPTAHSTATLVALRMGQLNVALFPTNDLLGIGDGRLGGLFRLKDDEAKVTRAVSLTIKGSFNVLNLFCRKIYFVIYKS